jgi:hypothetical protein
VVQPIVSFAVASALLSLVPEISVVPRAIAPWKRSWSALALHFASAALVYSIVTLVSARPWFASLITVSLVTLMVIVSNAKYASLREPFVFTDLSLFSQLFEHPRLYLPFLGASKIAAIALGVLMFVGIYLMEPPLADIPYRKLAAIGAVCALCVLIAPARLVLSLVPAEDVHCYGFFATFVAYLVNGLKPSAIRRFHHALATGPFARLAAPRHRPHMIVIQAESFFNARRLGPAIRPWVLQHFEAACAQSSQYGQLDVPAWGANTMRSEFAFLTGLSESLLGYARFYPYAFIRRPCTSLAAWCRRAAYRTVAIHPYHGDFFGRHRVFQCMHFDRFLDIAHFDNAQRRGPYVADAAVADAIIAELEAGGDRPTFVMAITMENHGPLHLERVLPGEGTTYHRMGDEPPWRDLTAYLRHLANADAMIKRLTDYLRSSPRDAVLCFYGDHVPALPAVYEGLGTAQSRSDYFIWRNFGATSVTRKHLSIAQLGRDMIGFMGLRRPVPQAAHDR